MRMYLVLLLLLIAVAASSSRAGDSSTDKPPTFFAVNSRHGEEHITGICSVQAADLLNCKIHDLQFIAPDLQKITHEQEEFRKTLGSLTPDQLHKEEERIFSSPNTPGPIDRRIRDERISNGGPKTKEFYQLMTKAGTEKNLAEFVAASTDHAKRTCKILNQTFELQFKKVGPTKWLANPGPEGLCNISKAYELERHPEVGAWWKLTETIVSVGDTTGVCKGLGSEEKQVTVWSPEMDEYELPCEFISWNP